MGRAGGVGPGAGGVDREACRSVPTVPAWATKVAALSTSLMVSVPEVRCRPPALVSVRLRVSAESTAASLVPRMLTVTVGERAVVRSHRRRSCRCRWSPATNSLWAELAV